MMKLVDFRLTRGFFDGLRPEPILSVAEWADKHRYLSNEASAEPGLWRTSRTPYLREIMEKLSNHDPCQRIIVMKGAQLGFTECGLNWIGYTIDNSPSSMMMVMPTVETVKRNSKIRVGPMIEATPRLYLKVKKAKSRDSSNTLFSKSFPGGMLILSGANSAASLRSVPVKKLMLDEVDAYPEDLDGEGSPVDLARKRSGTYAKKKEFMLSTPTIEDASVIEREFLEGDQRYYMVPCPHCGVFQRLTWDRLKWEKGNPESARYECEACEVLIEEYLKSKMIVDGVSYWKPFAPEKSHEKKASYHLSALYAPAGWYSWAEAADEWEKAQSSVPKLKVFVNTVLGETWVEKGEAPPWENLYNRRKQYPMNKPNVDVKMLTAGVDVQKDRLEVEIVGWCKDKITYSIDYRVIPGDTTDRKTWDKLAEVLNEQFEREDGVLLPILMMGVDSGYNTQHAYDFVRRHDPSKVFAIKGQERQKVILSGATRVDVNINGKQVGRATLFNVGVSILKSELYGWLKQEIDEEGNVPQGYCYFPEYGPDYFKGITGERLEFKMERGFKKFQWVKHFDRNEPLDCRVYARAAATLCGIDRFTDDHWTKLEQGYGTRKKDPAKKKRKRDGGFW